MAGKLLGGAGGSATGLPGVDAATKASVDKPLTGATAPQNFIGRGFDTGRLAANLNKTGVALPTDAAGA